MMSAAFASVSNSFSVQGGAEHFNPIHSNPRTESSMYAGAVLPSSGGFSNIPMFILH